MEKNTYSLWYMPSGEVYNKFAKIISDLAKEYDAPVFEPHVTLIGAIVGTEEALSFKTARLAELIKPFKIKLDRIDYFSERHKALIIRVEKLNKLTEANNRALEEFNLPTAEYIPHLSLLYGDFSVEIKKEIIKKLGRKFDYEFEVKSIYLYNTTGEEKEENWYKIKEFSLT